jgi:hypothetical protein
MWLGNENETVKVMGCTVERDEEIRQLRIQPSSSHIQTKEEEFVSF